MKFKKVVSMLLVAGMAVSMLVGCGGNTSNTTEETEKKEEKKTIKVGIEAAYPPFNYLEEDGVTIAGVDYDLANAIGEELGWKMEFVVTEWDAIFNDLEQKKFDVIISSVSMTDERKEKYEFSTPYIQNYQSIVTLSNATVKPTSLDMLSGLTVGYQAETVSQEILNEYMKTNSLNCITKDYKLVLDAFNALKAGEVNAVMCDSIISDGYCVDPTYEMTYKDTSSPDEFGVCLLKGSELVGDINKAIDALKANGKLDEILRTYLK